MKSIIIDFYRAVSSYLRILIAFELYRHGHYNHFAKFVRKSYSIMPDGMRNRMPDNMRSADDILGRKNISKD